MPVEPQPPAIPLLRAVVRCADRLLACPDADTLCREAVELCRTELGIERCALYLDDGQGGLRGTYGTGLDRRTTDERGIRMDQKSEAWFESFQSLDPGHPLWKQVEAPRHNLEGSTMRSLGVGWIVVTRIRGVLADRLEGVMFNDAHISGTPPDEARQEALAVFCTVLASILQRRRMEERVRLSERRYRQLFQEMSSGFALHEMVLDSAGAPADYRFLEVNPAFERLTGLAADRVTGRTVREVLPGIEPKWIETYGRVAATGESAHFREHSKELDRWFDVIAFSPERGQFAVVFTDVTAMVHEEEAKRRFQEQLLQTQKLEGLGLLAGGIAHDFNNLLVGVLGHADIAAMEPGVPPAVREHLASIESAARQAADLCKQLLAYSGKGRFVVAPISLNDVIEEMGRLLRVSVSKTTALRFDLKNPLPAVNGDVSQIRQVVMNLAINASEAIGAKPGILSIATSQMHCDRRYLAAVFHGENLAEGLYVTLEVSDNGCGIAPEDVAKIFDPFFTTKFTGRGLGLAAVLGIVRGHGGAIKVYSEPGRGTTFKVLLPAESQPPGPLPPAPQAPDSWTGTGTVLVADDEPSVRTVAAGFLARLGFETLAAADGEDAVATFRSHAGQIACVILDLTMPKLGGEDVFREIRRLRPDVPVILSSGYNEQEVTQRFTGRGLAGFIQKPYAFQELRRVLRHVLENPPPPHPAGG